jgi:hypothetical protein
MDGSTLDSTHSRVVPLSFVLSFVPAICLCVYVCSCLCLLVYAGLGSCLLACWRALALVTLLLFYYKMKGNYILFIKYYGYHDYHNVMGVLINQSINQSLFIYLNQSSYSIIDVVLVPFALLATTIITTTTTNNNNINRVARYDDLIRYTSIIRVRFSKLIFAFFHTPHVYTSQSYGTIITITIIIIITLLLLLLSCRETALLELD